MSSIRIIEIAPSLARRQAKWPWTVPFTAAAAAHRGGQIAQRARDRATAYFTSCVSFVSYLTLWNGADEIQYRSTATAASSSNALSSLPSTGLSIPWNASTAAADNCQRWSRFPRILLSQYMWVINSTSSGLYPDLFNVWNKSNCTKLHKSPLRRPVNILSTPDSAIYLTQLRPTATGVDSLPAWLLRIGAPVLCKCKPLTYLTFHSLTLSTSIVPTQWKLTSICPVRKVNQPTAHSHFRPISITPVLTRMMERMITRDFVYPAFLTPPPFLRFSDQFAFRPTGFTTAALTYLSSTPLQTSYHEPIRHCAGTRPKQGVWHCPSLQTNGEVRRAWHPGKYLQLAGCSGHSHCTTYRGQICLIPFRYQPV